MKKQELWKKQYRSHHYVDYIGGEPCIVPGCRKPSEACHARSKGAGGTWRDLFPACRLHHTEQHTVGIRTFSDRYGVDPYAVARELADNYDGLDAASHGW